MQEMTICRNCGCTAAQAAADALALGFLDEFKTGAYSCCQLVAWADEQWLAWSEAAAEDGKSEEEATKPLEIAESAFVFPYDFAFSENLNKRKTVPAQAGSLWRAA
jgi:hypothetical protein